MSVTLSLAEYHMLKARADAYDDAVIRRIASDENAEAIEEIVVRETIDFMTKHYEDKQKNPLQKKIAFARAMGFKNLYDEELASLYAEYEHEDECRIDEELARALVEYDKTLAKGL